MRGTPKGVITDNRPALVAHRNAHATLARAPGAFAKRLRGFCQALAHRNAHATTLMQTAQAAHTYYIP
eukprot:1178668-Prorocentrum_minimum.AAC.5